VTPKIRRIERLHNEMERGTKEKRKAQEEARMLHRFNSSTVSQDAC
jgi:hypothetical protein